ncbi:hypothetical protein ACU9F8_000718 [Cronobacter sakazakii]
MTKKEFTEKMRNIAESGKGKDAAMPHIEADELIIQWLRETGCVEAAEIFEGMEKWYE